MTGAGGWSFGWPALLPLAGFAFTLALGIFVWSRRGNAALQRSFAAFNIAVALWNLDVFLLFTLRDGEIAGRVDRLLQAPIIVMPFLALLFFFIFLGRRLSHPLLVGFGAWAGLLVVVSTGPSYLAGWRRLWFGWYGTPGALYPLFVGYLLAYLAISTTLLAREARATRDHVRRTQAQYLLAANLFLGLASLTNFLPLWGIPFLPLGNIASAAYVGVMALTIARHRLLDVQVLFRAGMLYSTLTFLLTVVYFALVLGLQRWFQDAVFAGSLLLPMLPALAVALAVGPLKSSLQERLDRTFFRSRAQMRARGEAFAEVLCRLESEGDIWRAAWEQGWRHAHPESGLVLRHADGAFLTAAGTGTAGVDAEAAGQLIAGLAGPRRLAAGSPFEIAVPVVGRGGLLGGCLLGPKSSGEIWSAEDLAFCAAIAGQTALAVEQARLRERSVCRSGWRRSGGWRRSSPTRCATRSTASTPPSVSCAARSPVTPARRCSASSRRKSAAASGSSATSCSPAARSARVSCPSISRSACASSPRAGPAGNSATPVSSWPPRRTDSGCAGDVFQLRQVFENLARNAVEAGGGGGRIAHERGATRRPRG